MKFIKTQEYLDQKVELIEEAIEETKETLKRLTIPRQIEAHESYLRMIEDNLITAKAAASAGI